MPPVLQILMVVTVLLIVIYVFFILRPYAARVHSEGERLAGIMSFVPHEMDVRSHVRGVLRHSHHTVKLSGGPSIHSHGRSSGAGGGSTRGSHIKAA